MSSAGVRKRPQQERARLTVEAILDAAVELFARDGYSATTTNHVAERAGVSIGSLYQYFADKDELVATLAQRHLDEATDALLALAEQLRRDAPDLETTVRTFVDAVVADHLAEPDLHRLLASAPRPPALRAALAAAIERIAVAVEHHLRRLHAGGSDPALRATLLVELVFALVHGALLDPPSGRDRDAVVAEIVAIAVRAVRN